MADSTPERRDVHYSGRVQGVGFRYTARSMARGFQITGFVRNLSDGRVQLVVEGLPAEVQAFLNALRAEMRHHIRSIEETTGPATGGLRGFEVRF